MQVRCRPLHADDSDRLLAWRNSPAVAAQMYTDHRIAPDEHARWFAAALSLDDRRHWVVEVDEVPAGLASLVRIDRSSGRADLGHYLAEPGAQGRGVGAAVEYFILDQALRTLGLNKLWAEVLAENERAWRLHEAFGFTREAHLRDHVRKGGRYRDVLGFGMLAADWEALRPESAARLRQRGVDSDRLMGEGRA